MGLPHCLGCFIHKSADHAPNEAIVVDTPAVSDERHWQVRMPRGLKDMDSDSLADSIAEELLNLTGVALLSRDFKAFKSYFRLPLRLETIEGYHFLETEEEFLEVFSRVLTHLDETEVEDLVRTVIHAEFVDPQTIRSLHICSEIHSGGELRRPAYPVHSTLVCESDKWRIVSCLYVILDNTGHNRALVNVPSSQLGDFGSADESTSKNSV